ncbi:MAG: PCMD domain-containing protein [Bacteroidales bacterium]|nr:PCMD domain-containing protein [Bacteroidales bacterium]
MKRYILTTVMLLVCGSIIQSQSVIKEGLYLADFENWYTRVIKESNIVGGDSISVFYIAPKGITREKGNLKVDTPWASSNVYSRVAGVTKANVNVLPVPGPSGLCAAIETSMMTFRAMGVNLNVVAAGAIYTGKIDEPVTSMDDPYSKIDMGMPFTSKPDYLYFDYKSKIQNSGTVTKASGFRAKTLKGTDWAQVFVILQKRWEKDGEIFAKRVGTADMFIDKSTDWVKGHKLKINYGQPKDDSIYTERCKLNSIFHTDNSSGERVAINEVDWAETDENPTHLILYISSGSLGPYVGEVGNILYVDNIGFEYQED